MVARSWREEEEEEEGGGDKDEGGGGGASLAGKQALALQLVSRCCRCCALWRDALFVFSCSSGGAENDATREASAEAMASSGFWGGRGEGG